MRNMKNENIYYYLEGLDDLSYQIVKDYIVKCERIINILDGIIIVPDKPCEKDTDYILCNMRKQDLYKVLYKLRNFILGWDKYDKE